jgi:hypothetical protein
MSDISPSSLKLTAAQEETVSNMTRGEDIAEYLKEVSIQNGLLKRDWDPALLIPVEQPITRQVGKVVVLNGVKHSLTANSDAELLAQETALYRAAMKPVATTQPQQTEQPRNDRGQFVAAQQTITLEERAALDLAFQLGQVSMSEYLERSNSVSDYLANQGIRVEDLREQVAEKQSEMVTQSWQAATDEFLAGAGNWWPGGDSNLAKIGAVLVEMGCEESPCVENLRRAAEYLRDNGQLVETAETKAHNQAVEVERIINETTDPYKLRSMLQPGQGLWGR